MSGAFLRWNTVIWISIISNSYIVSSISLFSELLYGKSLSQIEAILCAYGKFQWNIVFYICAAPWQNQCNVFETSMDPDQPAQSDQDLCCSLTNPITSRGTDSEQHGSCTGWSGSMLAANALCWFCHDAAHITFYILHVMYCQIFAMKSWVIKSFLYKFWFWFNAFVLYCYILLIFLRML
jgi:hypothetical protein